MGAISQWFSENWLPLALIILTVAAAIAFVVYTRRELHREMEAYHWDDNAQEDGWSAITERYGEPDDVVYLTGRSTSDYDDMILIYAKSRLWVVGSEPVPEEDIINVWLSSGATPSEYADFFLNISTRRGDISIQLGNDNLLAAEIVSRLSVYYNRNNHGNDIQCR